MTAQERSQARMGVLYEEHVALGGRFLSAEAGSYVAVGSYEGESEGGPARGGALLCDLTGITYILASGTSGVALCDVALAAGVPAVGRAIESPVLSNEAGLVSVPLAVRTGDTECVIVDASQRGTMLTWWLNFLKGATTDISSRSKPFLDASLEDATSSLVPLLIVGDAARTVLLDYVGKGQVLPGPGVVANVRLDAITTLVTCVRTSAARGCFLVLVPPHSARALWRSLLSFQEVEPCGIERLQTLMAQRLAWSNVLADDEYPPVTRSQLGAWGLPCRREGFVGVQALKP